MTGSRGLALSDDGSEHVISSPPIPARVGQSQRGSQRIRAWQQHWLDRRIPLPRPEWERRRANDALAVGYIPQHMSMDTFPPGSGFKELGWWQAKCYSGLFKHTGNPVPQSQFSGIDDLRRFLEGRQFRVAIWLTDVTVYFVDKDQIAGVAATRSWECGFTPYPGHDPRPGHGVECQWQGSGEPKGRLMQLFHVYGVKIGWLGNVGTIPVLGHTAPWAHLTLEGVFLPDGYAYRLSGSAIPSARLYVGWLYRAPYNTEECTFADLRGFNKTRGCHFPPNIPHVWWPETGPIRGGKVLSYENEP